MFMPNSLKYNDHVMKSSLSYVNVSYEGLKPYGNHKRVVYVIPIIMKSLVVHIIFPPAVLEECLSTLSRYKTVIPYDLSKYTIS